MECRLQVRGAGHTFTPPTMLFSNLDIDVHAGEVVALRVGKVDAYEHHRGVAKAHGRDDCAE